MGPHLDISGSRQGVTQANVIYHNKLAGTYGERHELFHPRVTGMYQRVFDRYVFPHCPPSSSLEVLDVGCGTGYLERFLVPHASDIVAFDVSDGMLDVARKSFPTVDYRLGDAYEMPIEDERQFDLVCENALLHHLKDYQEVLDGMARRVRPGGVLYLGCEPNRFAFACFSWIRSLYRKLAPEERVKRITEEHGDELEQLAEYHQFYGGGLCAPDIARFLRQRGFTGIKTLYRAEHFAGQLLDRLSWNLIEWLPRFAMRVPGPLSLNFHMVARKRPDTDD